MENKQTAISWLINELHYRMNVHLPVGLIEQAKQMEKEQIKDAATWGYNSRSGEQYYNETYGKSKTER